MKKIRTEMLKESIAEYANIAQSIKENSSDIVNSMLREAVVDEYARIMAEGFDKDEDEEEDFSEEENNEVKDTEIENDDADDTEDSEEIDDEVSEDSFDEEDESDDEGWDDFDDYKVEGADDDDEQYDFSKADDETLVKVYKRLTDSDEVVVKMDKDKSKLELKDNSTGNEYIIDLDMSDDDSCEDEECTFEVVVDDENNDINESKKVIEIVLNENSNLGYTTTYQKSDAMTTPSMSEPGKNVNDWDAGVPKGKERPYGKVKSKATPFTEEDMPDMNGGECDAPVKEIPSWGTNGKGKQDNSDKFRDYGVNQYPKTKKVPAWGTELSEGLDECGNGVEECGGFNEGDDLEEATNVGGAVQQRSKGAKSHIPSGRKKYGPYPKNNVSVAGEYEGDININIKQESMNRKHAAIVKENNAMKRQLRKLTGMMEEAAVTNMSLGQIVKLLNENSTTQDEKKEIYARFNEVKTIEESKQLYNTISRELSKRTKMDINEDKQYTTENSQKINENTIYASKDLLTSLDIMHKICK